MPKIQFYNEKNYETIYLKKGDQKKLLSEFLKNFLKEMQSTKKS